METSLSPQRSRVRENLDHVAADDVQRDCVGNQTLKRCGRKCDQRSVALADGNRRCDVLCDEQQRHDDQNRVVARVLPSEHGRQDIRASDAEGEEEQKDERVKQ